MDFIEDFDGNPLCTPARYFPAYDLDGLEVQSSHGNIDHTGQMEDGIEEYAEVNHGWQTDDEYENDISDVMPRMDNEDCC